MEGFMDRFNHKIDYLRISVTDRCNLRCVYCMPMEGIISRPHHELLTLEEILRLSRILVSSGISKIRLTGGEPLVRKGITGLITSLAQIQEISDLSLTTNGALLYSFADRLKNAGLQRINISLDTLKEDKFRRIARCSSFDKILEGIDRARQNCLHPLKVNVVVMKGINDDEIIDFVEFAFTRGLILRFIEFMNITPLWDKKYFFPIEEVKRICASRFSLKMVGNFGPGPAAYYEVDKQGMLGFINTNEGNCSRCNRLRLTSTGELKICLYEIGGLNLRESLRQGLTDQEIKNIIRERLYLKNEVDYKNEGAAQAYMSKLGG